MVRVLKKPYPWSREEDIYRPLGVIDYDMDGFPMQVYRSRELRTCAECGMAIKPKQPYYRDGWNKPRCVKHYRK